MARRGAVARIAPAVAVALMIAACATQPGARPLRVGEPTPLVVDTPVALPDRSKLTFLGLHADSRCPRHVTCIHAGSAQVRLRHVDVSGIATEMTLEAPRATSADLRGGWRLALVDVDGMTQQRVHVRIDPHR